MNFDAKNPLVMNARRTVLGHALNRGVALTVVDKPRAAGEVDEQTATLLFNKKIALPRSDFRPTPEAPAEVEPEKLTSRSKKKSAGTKDPEKTSAPPEGSTSAASGSKETGSPDPEKKKTD